MTCSGGQTERETRCYSWHGFKPSHCFKIRPGEGGEKAPRSLSLKRTSKYAREVIPPLQDVRARSAKRRGVLRGQWSPLSIRRTVIVKGSLGSRDIESPVFQDTIDARGHLPGHRDDGFASRAVMRVPGQDPLIKFLHFRIPLNGAPGAFYEHIAQARVSGTGDVAFVDIIAGGTFAGSETKETGKLPNVFKIAPISDPGDQVSADGPSDAGNADKVFQGL